MQPSPDADANDDKTRSLGSPPKTDATNSAAPEDDAALARALAARGVPAEEIERLLALGKPQQQEGQAKPPQAPVPPTVPPVTHFEPKPFLTFPPFREPTDKEAEEADRLLRQAALSRRRGRFAEAARACARAIELVPKDATALELYGDILQSLGRVDDALAAYRRAVEANPSRASAEKKYAALLLLQDRSVTAIVEEEEARNPYVAVLLSALCPGAGQFYNGDIAKALALALSALVLIVLLLWTPLGFASVTKGPSPTSAFVMACVGAVYVFALIDANIGARASKQRKGGWDV